MSKRASIQLHACVPFLLPTISLGSSAGLSPWPTIQLSRDSICARAALSHCPLPGFLREEDYMQARDSFLHSLDFQVHSGTSSGPVMAAAGSGGAMRSSMGPASAFSSLQHPQHHQQQHRPQQQQQQAPPPPPLGAMLPPPPPGGGSAANGGAAASVFSVAAAAAPGGQKAAPSSSSGGLAMLADLPRIGKAGVAEGKVGRGCWREEG